MKPRILRLLQRLGFAFAVVGALLWLVRGVVADAGWPEAAPPGAVGALLALIGLILLLVPGRHRPV